MLYDLVKWDTTRYTDWQRELYGGTGKNTSLQLGLSGGDASTSFRLGGGYQRTTSITTVSGADQQASFSMSVGHKTKNQRLSISVSTNFAYSQSDMISLPASVVLPPNAPAIFDANGNLNYDEWRVTRNFPFASLRQPYVSKTTFVNAGIGINYEITKGLHISTNFGYNNAQVDQVSLMPAASKDPMRNEKGSAYFGNNSNKGWIIEPQLNYETFLGKGKLSLMMGSSLQQTETKGLSIFGEGYTDDALLHTISNAGLVLASEYYGQYKYMGGVFASVNYNLSNKYIVSLNGRRDGSTKFGSGKQFGNFGSVGVAWIFRKKMLSKKYFLLSVSES